MATEPELMEVCIHISEGFIKDVTRETAVQAVGDMVVRQVERLIARKECEHGDD